MSVSMLLAILALFHVFVYKLSEGMILKTEQGVLRNKLDILAQIAGADSKETQSARTWLPAFAEAGQAIRLVKNGRVEAQINKGIHSSLFLPTRQPSATVSRVVKHQGKRFSVLAVPIHTDKGTRIELYTDFTSVQRYLDTLLTALMIGSSILLLVVSAGGYLMSAIALNPVRRISQTVKKLDPSHLDSRLIVPDTRDEIAEMSRTFNQLLDRIYESVERQRQFVADASHELRTPVSVIRGYTNLLRRWGKEDPQVIKEALEAIDQEAARMERMTAHLLMLARFEDLGTIRGSEWVELNEVCGQRVRHWRNLLSDRRLIFTPFSQPLQIPVARSDLEKLLDILLDNAGKYSRRNSTITVTVTSVMGEAKLVVEDTGEGIPREAIPHVFERFYRASQARVKEKSGSGLGLAIARQIVEAYGGRITLDSREGEWTRVEVILPISH
ncbi:two-component sensor histidine kinase [Marinithermofilum abyssi]|uniref:histidine kinase n=1 Tax=Marinithermofilum abyssi TaxID=1571185 RepID=A0A8J2VE07_9BACL|nr:two-component sensor histidine kinase [Marinithermofilum abyssi]